MLVVENGGDKQIDDELHGYNPLLPQGNNLVFMFMLEYTSTQVRNVQLAKLGK